MGIDSRLEQASLKEVRTCFWQFHAGFMLQSWLLRLVCTLNMLKLEARLLVSLAKPKLTLPPILFFYLTYSN